MYTFKRLEPNSISITPFKAYKEWLITNSNCDQYGIVSCSGQYEDFSYDLEDIQTTPRATNADGSYKYLIHASQNHLFYNNTINYFNYNTSDAIITNLYNYITFIAIPQTIYGEQLKRNSIIFNVSSHFLSTDFGFSTQSLIDDGVGNLIDAEVKYHLFDNGANLNEIVDNVILNLDFGVFYKQSYIEGFRHDHIDVVTNKTNINDISFQNSIYQVQGHIYNGEFKKYDNSAGAIGGLGTCWVLSGSSYLELSHNSNLDMNTDDQFTLSALCNISSDISEDGYIIIKSGKISQGIYSDGTKVNTDYDANSNYPYSIKYIGSGANRGKIVASRFDGQSISEVMSTSTYNDDAFHLIAFSKSGSNLVLAVDDDINSATDNSIYATNNYSNIFVGSLNGYSYFMSGSIKNIKIYDTAMDLNATKMVTWSLLEKNGIDSYYVGNVFYNHGFINLTNQAYQYILNNGDTWSIKFNSVKSIYEYEIICSAKANEFNISTNPTLQYQNTKNAESKIQDKYTSSLFNPYITAVGLYDDYGNLLAVGKLSSPIKKPKNNDINIVIKFDV